MKTNLFKSLLVATMAIGALGGVNSAFADNEEVIVNENFNTGTVPFKAASRITLANDDNNIKFTTANNSTNGFSNATYDFDTKGATAVKVQFSYYIANNSCNYDVAFIIRDKDVTATHAKQKIGLDGAFISIGRCRDRVNYFSINRNKTASASNDNLGLWCNAEVYIDLIKKTIDYTISKLDGGAVIKSETGIAFKDANAVNVSQIDFFACVNNETDYLDNLVITKYTSDLSSYNYTINAVCGNKIIKQLSTGVSQENSSYSISNLPFALMEGGICYRLNDSDVKDYKKTFTMGKTDATEKVLYTVADDISYFFEAEDILSKSYGNSTDGVFSSGITAGVNSGANLTMSSIASGKYTVTVNSSVRRSKEDILKVQVSSDNNEWTDAGLITLKDSKGGNYSIENVNLPKDGSIRLVENKNQNMCHYIDYVTLQRTGDATETVSVTEAGYATYATKYNVEVPNDENVKVMTVKVNDDKTSITLNNVAAGTLIPANTGILVKATAGKYDFSVTSKECATLDNDLKAATTDVTSDGTKFFALTKIGDKVGFALVENGVVIPAGKAYLEVTKGTAAKFFSLDGEATGINSVKTAKADGAYYTLEGVKTTKPVKGLYIHNGKKIVVK